MNQQPVYEYVINPVTGKREPHFVGYNILDAKHLTIGGVPLSDWRSHYDGRYGVPSQRRDNEDYLSPADMRKAKNIPPAAESGTDWLRSSKMAPQSLSSVVCGCGKRLTMSDVRLKCRRCKPCRAANRKLRKPKEQAA